MSQAITLQVPATVQMPRGARWAAAFFIATAGVFRAVRKAVDHRQGDCGRDAAELRRFAASVSKSDPAFAADLYAAADRHIERGMARK